MEPTQIASSVISGTVDFVASTNFGQFLMKKCDAILRTFEIPAKYSVKGDSKADNRELPWLLFWIVLINLQIFRTVSSTILVKLNRKPIEAAHIVSKLQKWRRSLRSIRFRGLRKIREQQNGNAGRTAFVL